MNCNYSFFLPVNLIRIFVCRSYLKLIVLESITQISCCSFAYIEFNKFIEMIDVVVIPTVNVSTFRRFCI